jgi:plasmid stability protein
VPSIQIKNVPDEVHRVHHRRAAAAGQSLQEYLLARLIQDARQPTLDEVLDDAEADVGGELGLGFAVQSQREDRDER